MHVEGRSVDARSRVLNHLKPDWLQVVLTSLTSVLGTKLGFTERTATFKHWATSLGPEPWFLSRLSFLTTWMESNQKAFLLGTKISKRQHFCTDLQAELPAWVIEHHFILKCLADKLYSFTLGDLTGIFSFLKNERSKSVTSRRTTGSTGCQW